MEVACDMAWGKYDQDDGCHYLAHHMADVAACFLALAHIPVWRKRLEKAAGDKLDGQQIERLAVLVFLHDAGKLYPGFQCKIWNEEQRAASGCAGRTGIGHPQAGAELFLSPARGKIMEELSRALQAEKIAQWGDPDTLSRLLLASLAHHGRPVSFRNERADMEPGWRPLGDYDPLPDAVRIGGLMRKWFPLAFAEGGRPLPDAAGFQHLFAGLVSLADWLGSDRDFFPYAGKADEAYIAKAMQQAQVAVRAVGLDIGAQRRNYRRHPGKAGFRQLTGHAQPNWQQEATGRIPPDVPFVILEAETGSGKTEAALWRFVKLYEAGEVDGLYFAVPTRTAAVQLHGRVHQAMKRLFGDFAPQSVLAVPGYFRAGEHQGRPLPDWKVLWDEGEGLDNERLANLWAAEHSKRWLAAQVAVGTVDQAMLGALPVKHAHMRASAMARNLLVIDEVHASDPYMTIIQQKLIEDHMKAGGHVLAMSATLGSHVRARWLGQTPPPLKEALQTGYPAIWRKGHEEPIIPGPDEAQGEDKIIGMSLLATMDAQEAACRAIEAARQGAKTLVVRNTVDEAVKTFEAVREKLDGDEQHLLFSVNGISTLHHGRFAAEDRRLLDRRVEDVFGKSGQRPEPGMILIGTQTLEQSLDICADYLISDLCPADVLLQRLGRLHRHGSNPRPKGFEQPRCLVMAPENGLAPCLRKMINGLGGWQGRDGTLSGIYLNVAGLELTRRLIEKHKSWRIPSMNRKLVEGATHPEQIEALITEMGGEWREYQRKLESGEMAEAYFAAMQALDRSREFEELKFPDEGAIRTRLGEDGFTIAFEGPVKGPFGEMITRLVIPAHMSRGIAADAEAAVIKNNDQNISIEICGKTFSYDYKGLCVSET